MARLPLSDMLMRKTSSPGEALEAGKGGVPSPVEADQIKGTADDTALLRSSTVPSDTPGMKNRIFCRSPNSKLYVSRLHHSQVRLCSGGVFLTIMTSCCGNDRKIRPIVAYSRRFVGKS